MNDNMVVEALRYMLALGSLFIETVHTEVEEKLTSVEEENARLKEENERLYLLYQEAVEIIESAMDERCSWCMGKDGKHEPDCEANNWLVSSPNKTQEVEA